MNNGNNAPRLGRGLAALFGETGPSRIEVLGPRATLPITALEPGPFQPRSTIDAGRLADLASSIRQQGVLQPLLVRPHPVTPDHYQIVAGERRWRAAQAAGLHDVPVLVRTLSDTDAMAASLVENLQRHDLDPIEEAEAYKRLISEFGLTQDQLGGMVGKSRSHIANTIRLLTLPDAVRIHVQSGALSAGHGRALLAHPEPEMAARTVIARGLNVRQTETFAQRSHNPNAGPALKAPPDRETIMLERDLAARLGLAVQVISDGKSGSVRIQFQTLDQLEGLISLLMRN